MTSTSHLTSNSLLLSILFSFFLSALCSALISKFAYRIALIDNPNKRSSHSIPTPRGGGIGIWLAFILIFLFQISTYDLRFTIFIIVAGFAGLLGFLEDRFSLPSKPRLLIQLILSSFVIFLFSDSLPFTPHASHLTSYFLFLFWILFITGTANFYNFMDGINGIAGLTGIVGFSLMAYFSYFIANEPNIGLMCIVLATGCLGFLPFNFPKAKVFMGDVGSVFLGFVFASFVVKLSTTISAFLCLSIFLFTFHADSIVTIFYRWIKGENLMKAHRSHLYQYMSNELGLPHWIVSISYALAQLVFGLLALFAYSKGLSWQFAVFATFGIMFLVTYKVIKNIKPRLE